MREDTKSTTRGSKRGNLRAATCTVAMVSGLGPKFWGILIVKSWDGVHAKRKDRNKIKGG